MVGRRALALAGAILILTAIGIWSGARDVNAPARFASPEPSMFAGAYRFGSCATTTVTTWSPVMPFGRGIMRLPDRRVVIGGRLAAPPTRNLTSNSQWYVASSPKPMIQLRATRLDRNPPPIDFAAVGYSTTELLPSEWDRGWYYRTATTSDVFPTLAGCWKIQLLDLDPEADVIVVELRGIIGPPRVAG
ncbi:MAG: hypothetical protein E6J52_06115 [Chloroflexi bacterium]|nr:MAG: hypothetical protein E6J52_06115 [Chloroflexota bacterium]